MMAVGFCSLSVAAHTDRLILYSLFFTAANLDTTGVHLCSCEMTSHSPSSACVRCATSRSTVCAEMCILREGPLQLKCACHALEPAVPPMPSPTSTAARKRLMMAITMWYSLMTGLFTSCGLTTRKLASTTCSHHTTHRTCDSCDWCRAGIAAGLSYTPLPKTVVHMCIVQHGLQA